MDGYIVSKYTHEILMGPNWDEKGFETKTSPIKIATKY